MPLRIVLVLLLTAVPVPGFAHMILNGPPGGEVEDATPGPNLHIETVVKGSTVTVYLSDFNETAISATGVAGKIIVLANEKKDYFNLAPSGPNALTGQGTFTATPEMKALVTLTVSGQEQKALFSFLHPQ
jgi:hypothetical protein